MAEFGEERRLRLMSAEDGRDIEAGESGEERELTIQSAEWLVTQALDSLERAETLTELKALHDKAIGVHGFAKQQRDCFGLQQAAANLRIRAQHKAGKALSEIQREPGKRTDELTEYQRVLGEERLDTGIAYHWQKIASIPDDVLLDFLSKCLSLDREITTAEVLRLLPEPHLGTKSGSSLTKPQMKSRRVLLVDTTELTIQEQDDIIWEAIGRAHLIAKKEKMREELQAVGQYPGYWLAHICAEYNAHNQLEGEQ